MTSGLTLIENSLSIKVVAHTNLHTRLSLLAQKWPLLHCFLRFPLLEWYFEFLRICNFSNCFDCSQNSSQPWHCYRMIVFVKPFRLQLTLRRYHFSKSNILTYILCNLIHVFLITSGSTLIENSLSIKLVAHAKLHTRLSLLAQKWPLLHCFLRFPLLVVL